MFEEPTTRSRSMVAKVFVLVTLMVTGLAGVARAVHNSEFQLEGNIVDDAAAGEDFDWVNFFNGSGPGGDGAPSPALPNASRPGFIASGFKADYELPNTSAYATGTKDILPISGWQCKSSNNIGDKFDIVNAYTVAYRATNGHLILYFASEISSPNGDRNAAFWFLQDENVGCTSGGGNTDWDGAHQDGDLLVVSAFTGGGSTATVSVYRWNGGEGGSLGLTPLATGGECGSGGGHDACAIVNETNVVDPPWNAPDKNGGNLDPLEFFEGGVDLTALNAEECFATFVANSRSSQSPTSTLHDFAAGSLPVCGEMRVHKYVDVDLSGTRNAGDINSGTAVTGWTFSVAGPSPSTTVKCSGTTDSTGTLVCSTGSLSNLTPGDYTVTESSIAAGMFNSDPGPIPTTGTAVKTVTQGVGSQDVYLGNTCFVDKTFQINNVPTGASAPTSVKVDYTITAGPNNGATATLTLPQSGSTASTTLNDTLVQTNTINWSWYINNDTGTKVTGATGESLSSAGWPTCAKTNSTNFPFATLTGSKYKDMDNSGTRNGSPLEPPLAGFDFTLLVSGTTTQVGSTATSATDGTYSFANVPPGSYTVVEVAKTGWVQTEPSSGGRSVTVALGDTSKTIDPFGNTPLSSIGVTFTPLTSPAATRSTITCTGPVTMPTAQTDGTYSATNLKIGTYNCSIVIVDP